MKQEGTLTHDLKGKTLQVYLYLMRKNEPAGIREIQRELNLSSPSVANYQIEKLIDLGLVGKDNHGRYYLLHKVGIPSLKAYVNLGKFIVPRLAFYAGFFTTLLGIYIVLNVNSLNMFALAFGSIGTAMFWYEAFRFWKIGPVTVDTDLSTVKPFIEEKRNEIVPYIALGILLVATSTVGFDTCSNFLTEYVDNQQNTYVTEKLLSIINTDLEDPADRISESVSFAKQRTSYAMQEGAYGPGVPIISAASFPTLMVVLPFASAMTIAFVLYTMTKISCKEQVLN